jgi:hypothetical protein
MARTASGNPVPPAIEPIELQNLSDRAAERSEAQMRAKQGFRMVFLGHDMVQLPLAFQEMKRGAAQLAAAKASP